MSVYSFDDMKQHVGHKIACVSYGYPVQNVAIECETCNEVLMDFDRKNKSKRKRTLENVYNPVGEAMDFVNKHGSYR